VKQKNITQRKNQKKSVHQALFFVLILSLCNIFFPLVMMEVKRGSRFPTYISTLHIRPSHIPQAGLGLYTSVLIRAGSFIDVYHGRVLTEEEYDAKTKALTDKETDAFCEYLLWGENFAKQPVNIVADQPDDCYSRYANDGSLQGLLCNAKFAQLEKPVQHLPQPQKQAFMCLIALFDILPNDEIYVGYGGEYWKEDVAWKYKALSTKRRRHMCIQRIKEQMLTSKECIVWRTPSLLVVAKWKKDCASTTRLLLYEGGVLEHDPTRKRWLTLEYTCTAPTNCWAPFSPCFRGNPFLLTSQ
jgi:hypothetical protein